MRRRRCGNKKNRPPVRAVRNGIRAICVEAGSGSSPNTAAGGGRRESMWSHHENIAIGWQYVDSRPRLHEGRLFAGKTELEVCAK